LSIMQDIIRNRLASKVVKLRNQQGISQDGLSELSGVSISFIKDIELKKANPSVEILDKMATALAVDIKDLL